MHQPIGRPVGDVLFAISSHLNLSRLRQACARRQLSSRSIDEKRELITRLQQKYMRCSLPKCYSETRVEQSFVEQLFSKIFDYRTLFSCAELPFHILPKNFFSGNYDDFSIGYFGLGRDQVIVSVELKSPGANLDAPQTGQYHGQTPVEQAITTARAEPSCRWVVVSNLQELRLYSVIGANSEPIARVDLLELRFRQHIALLCAIFDKRALLGKTEIVSEMETYVDPSHATQPVASLKGHCRLVLQYTPSCDQPLSLFATERCLYDAVVGLADSRHHSLTSSPQWVPAIKLAGGWVSCEDKVTVGDGWRVCLSRYGELQYSAFLHCKNNAIEWLDLVDHVLEFWKILNMMTAPELRTVSTGIGVELLDLAGTTLIVPAESVSANGCSSGIAPGREVIGEVSGFSGGAGEDALAALMSCLCDIAIQFRGSQGGIALDVGRLARQLRDG